MEMELGLETLEQYQTRVKLTEAQSAQIMVGVFSALEYLHDEVNVIHRDLKPENIVIMDYDDLTKVKLIDFGLAVESTKNSIQDFAKCGTLLYTPPEQVLNNFAYAKVRKILNLIKMVESRHVGRRYHYLPTHIRQASTTRPGWETLGNGNEAKKLYRNSV